MQLFMQTLVGGIGFGAVYALVGMGFTIVYRTMGLVNFAHGQIAMIGAFLSATFFLDTKLPFAVAAIMSMAATAVVGLVIEGILRPLEARDFDLMLIGTLGFGVVLEAVATRIWGATGRAVPAPVDRPLQVFGIIIRTYDLVVIGVGAVAAVAVWVLLNRTKAGAAMQAVAMDRDAATSVGIRVGRSNAMAFALGAGLAALAGTLAAPLLYVTPSLGSSLGIKGFCAAILGGFGNINGAVIGGLAFGILDGFAAGHFQQYSDTVTFLVFAIAIMVRPTGILGELTVNRA
ncbi:MAG TPA: branched-chain amino acid ABC transporter permease [Acidothermaceae bacterium]